MKKICAGFVRASVQSTRFEKNLCRRATIPPIPTHCVLRVSVQSVRQSTRLEKNLCRRATTRPETFASPPIPVTIPTHCFLRVSVQSVRQSTRLEKHLCSRETIRAETFASPPIPTHCFLRVLQVHPSHLVCKSTHTIPTRFDHFLGRPCTLKLLLVCFGLLGVNTPSD